MEFKDVLKTKRNELNLSQRALAELMEISVRTLQDWEQGRRKPNEFTKKAVLEKINKIKEDLKMYGKVNFNGIKITLTEEAHWEYMSNSTEPNDWMIANGIDEDGNKYRVEFKIKEMYADDEEARNELEVDTLFDFNNPTYVYSFKDNKYL